jgi:hypothetical protein
MVNDEQPTDYILFTTDKGLNRQEYKFTNEKIRVSLIVIAPSDTIRGVICLGSLRVRPRRLLCMSISRRSQVFNARCCM